MKFFIDTADVAEIARSRGQRLRRRRDHQSVPDRQVGPQLPRGGPRDLRDRPGPGQRRGDGGRITSDMLAEGRKLAQLAPNVCVKVPLTWDGLKACRALTDEGTQVNVTLCFPAGAGAARRQGRRHLHLAVRRPARRCRPGRHAADLGHRRDLPQLPDDAAHRGAGGVGAQHQPRDRGGPARRPCRDPAAQGAARPGPAPAHGQRPRRVPQGLGSRPASGSSDVRSCRWLSRSFSWSPSRRRGWRAPSRLARCSNRSPLRKAPQGSVEVMSWVERERRAAGARGDPDAQGCRSSWWPIPA